MKRLVLALALLLAPLAAHAQSSPGLSYGQVPTAGQWNSYFAAKQDYNPGAVTLTGSGTSGHVAQWSGVAGLLQDGGALPLGASPGVNVGLSATNGVATTYMRSDAAPALSQAISPTWSGTHTFTNAPVFTAQANTRTALGLGTAATVATGTSGATIPLLNGANTFSGASIFSSTLAPNGGLVGVTTNSNAAAGQVGEYVSANVAFGSAVSLVSLTAANVTSISLTAGDWDVRGTIGMAPNAATVTSTVLGSIGTTSATIATAPNGGASATFYTPATAGIAPVFFVGMTRISLASTTTVYLVANANFSTNTNAAYGFIGARRVR